MLNFVYTLGTSTRTLDEFLEILKFYKIETVIDVRRWPSSARYPHFNKPFLFQFLEKNKISYHHLEALGGYRKESYEEYMKTEEFKIALESLISVIQKSISCIICAERFPWKCHRRFIGLELQNQGFKVFHIIEKGKIWIPKGVYSLRCF